MQARVLDNAEGSTGWSSRSPVAVVIPPIRPAVEIDRRLRKNADGTDAATLLKATDIPPISYEDGKIVMAPGRVGSGDRLRMRGMPIHYYGFNALRDQITGTGSPVVENLASIQNNRPLMVSGLKITRDGLVVDMGGKGAGGTDFRANDFRVNVWGPLLYVVPGQSSSGQGLGQDLTFTFGRPAASPQGNAERFWTTVLMPTTAQVNAAGGAGGWLKDGDRTLPVGAYELRLSNHLGVDGMLEDPDGSPYPDDDVNYYLSYAAYGHMDFFRPGTTASTAEPRGTRDEHGIHRIFPFHVGYDAFKDEAGMRTADIAAADRIVSGMFKGRTMAVRFNAVSWGLINANPDLVTRMRGDVELTATITPTLSNNTITGRIMNMEDWDQTQRSWKPSTIIPSDVNFATDGRIDVKGEFTGTFANYPSGYRAGGYRGNFYGPLESLEAAGAWAMSPAFGQSRAIAGSFGAARIRDDGSYGTKVSDGN